MKITIIYGNQRHGSTYGCVQIFKEELQKLGSIEFTEFFLPKDMPQICCGCFSCIYKGEEYCPHYAAMRPIEEALLASDGIVLASPTYVMSCSGQMKIFLDHFASWWLPHRPQPSMFRKAGMVISTTAGAGAGKCANVMKDSLAYWGIKRIFSFKKAVLASSWEGVKPVMKEKMKKELTKTADCFYNTLLRIDRLPASAKTRLLFSLVRGMQKKNKNEIERKHWESNGWLSGKKPF